MAVEVEFPRGAKVLVTGATGYTGQVLTRKLVSLGCEVTAIARASSKREGLSELPIRWVVGDVYDAKVVANATQDIEYIFHVAAAYREAGISEETYANVHIESTKLLAQAVVASGSCRRFVHVSTVGVHGHIDEPPADEEYRFAPGDIYQSTKAEGEQWIRSFSVEHGLPLVVVRPAAIYGPGDRRLLKLFKMARRPFFPVFGSGRGLYHLIHVDDLTDIFVTAALHPQAVGEVFIAGNAEPSRLQDIVKTIANEIGNPRLRFVRLPVWPLFVAADLCEFVCRPLGIAPPIYRRRVAFFTKDRAFNTRKLREVLGYRYTHTVEEGLRTTARWYREHRWL